MMNASFTQELNKINNLVAQIGVDSVVKVGPVKD